MPLPYVALIDQMTLVDHENAAAAPAAPAYAVTIPEDWMQGRTTYGGLTAALCYEAVAKSLGEPAPLRSAQISFIGPAGGPVRVAPTMLRQGKSVSFAGADLFGEKGLAARAVFAFGAGRASEFDRSFAPPVNQPPPDECEPFFPGGFGPAFAQHYDARLAQGGRPISGSPDHDHFVWVRHHDDHATSTAALLALADMPPPAMMPMFKTPAPISTMTWQLNFLTDAPTTRDGWWLLQSRAENAAQGYSSQDMLVWNRDGAPIIAGRQSVAIFA